MGRPSLTPGIYFRCLLTGYFEGIDSERGIAWRIEDSLSPRRFLAIGLDESAPDHSTISRTQRLIDVETHREVFAWALRLPAGEGNRGRIRGARGKGLLRLRGERVERSFAHCYETGGMRRLHLRGRANILKRLLIHVGAFNLSLALRKALGAGTPRGLADALKVPRALAAALGMAVAALAALWLASSRRPWTARDVFALPRPIPPFPVAA